MSFSADTGFFEFVDAGASSGVSHEDSKDVSSRSSFAETEMYTIGTPLPRGESVADKLDTWISDREDGGKTPAQPVGHMELLPIHKILKYAFDQEDLKTSEHKALLKSLKAYADKPYCSTLLRRGLLTDCKRGKKFDIQMHKHKVAEYPIDGNDGEDIKCKAGGVFRSACGAGSSATCKGSFSYGECE